MSGLFIAPPNVWNYIKSNVLINLFCFQLTFVNAFLGKRTDIIKQILSSNENFALSKQEFTALCQEVIMF